MIRIALAALIVVLLVNPQSPRIEAAGNGNTSSFLIGFNQIYSNSSQVRNHFVWLNVEQKTKVDLTRATVDVYPPTGILNQPLSADETSTKFKVENGDLSVTAQWSGCTPGPVFRVHRTPTQVEMRVFRGDFYPTHPFYVRYQGKTHEVGGSRSDFIVYEGSGALEIFLDSSLTQRCGSLIWKANYTLHLPIVMN